MSQNESKCELREATQGVAEIAGETVVLRGYEDEDLNFILATWIRSERDHMKFHWRLQRHRAPAIYWVVQNAKFVVACSPKVRSTIFGWVCYTEEPTRNVPHWAYVVHDLRGNGLLKIMAREIGV